MHPFTHLAAVVLAAGRSTRMRSARPKVAHDLAGEPLIRYPLHAVQGLGADPIVVVVGFEAAMVEAACAGFPVRFAVQAEQRGTGHAVQCALPQLEAVRGDVILMYGDLPLLTADVLEGLVRAHRAAGATLSLLTAHLDDPTGYGRIVRQQGRVTHIVEQRDATAAEQAITEVNVGIYCADADFLRTALPQLQPNNAQGELYLTDIVALARRDGRAIADAEAPQAQVAQVNWRGELADMEQVLRVQINRRWMEAGVTLEDPDTTYIDAAVEIGPDTIIGPNVHLRGATRIGARCRLDGSAYLRDARIGDGAHLKFSVMIIDADVGPECDVGPFAHLRAGTDLAARVSIGNFVETKKARIGTGTKARHLSYLGDADIGSDSNVGAGTIICNYDGWRKQRTTIGSRVMIGSDSQLVAPVTVGDDAYVATSTTVMKDVPAGALAFTSKTQLVRPGWTAARRAREAAADAPSPPAAPAKKTASRARTVATPKRRTKRAARPAPRPGKTAARVKRRGRSQRKK